MPLDAKTCPTCKGARWVCEAHPDRPHGIDGGCDCGEPGMPCRACNRTDGERAAPAIGASPDTVTEHRESWLGLDRDPALGWAWAAQDGKSDAPDVPARPARAPSTAPVADAERWEMTTTIAQRKEVHVRIHGSPKAKGAHVANALMGNEHDANAEFAVGKSDAPDVPAKPARAPSTAPVADAERREMTTTMLGPIFKRAQALVEETRRNIDRQREIVVDLKRRGLDATAARKLLGVWEETLVRRIEILNQMRTKAREKRERQ